MSRTVAPVRAAAAAAPEQTAAIPSARDNPRATCRSGPHRISTYRTLSAAFVSTSSAVIRSSASASCISAIGRSNARRSSAWSTHGIGAMSARDMPAHEPGASMPRVRASSSAVSMRSEPSRWRCSSAFGIAATSRRRVGPAGASMAWAAGASGDVSGGSITRRCYDSAAALTAGSIIRGPQTACPPSWSPAPPVSSAAGRSRPSSTRGIVSSRSSGRRTPASSCSSGCPPRGAGASRPASGT